MRKYSIGCLILVAILMLALNKLYTQAYLENKNSIKSAEFLSPMFELGPGSVENRFYYNVDFPTGHVAIKSFDAEVIDEAGNSIPLHETYLHHWVVARYYARKGAHVLERNGNRVLSKSDFMFARNSGVCQNLGQYFGLGSETRGTNTHVPDPFGIEIGNPEEIPAGYEEKWMLNVHAIDTRGVEDKLGCTECRCNLYNVTVDEYGRKLRPEYKGGLFCCYDHTQCKVRHGFEGVRRSLYLKYKVTWVDWDSSIVPVKIYIFDVTDTWKLRSAHHCLVEYEVEACGKSGVSDDKCIHNKKTTLAIPTGGYLIYGVAHQHSGGIGSALYREYGEVVCASIPTYGQGNEAGDEAGYIVGISTCYPKPGSVKLADGETLVLESNYSSSQYHSGVMGLFYILVADSVPMSQFSLHAPLKMNNSTIIWGVVILLGVVAAVVGIVVVYRCQNKRGDEYQPIMT